MSDEQGKKKEKKDEKDDVFYSDILSALDAGAPSAGKSAQAGQSSATSSDTSAPAEAIQTLFPFAPDMKDPNAFPDFQGAKFYIDTRNYDKAVNTLINIFRANNPAEKNMAAELVLDLAKTVPNVLAPMLPYLFIVEGSDDPIINMNINNALIYLRDPYNAAIAQLKTGIKVYIETYYTQLNTTYIPFMDILRAMGTSYEVIIKVLEAMTKNREVSGKLDYTTQVFAYEPPGALFLCPHCGVEIKKDATFCPNCHEDVFKCAICFRFIKNQDLVKCPKCNATAHEQHFLEWVKKTGSCPVCQNKLYEQQVARISCSVCGLEIKKDEKIENLIKCPHCATVSHKDHFIDYLRISKVCPECKKPVSVKELKDLIKKK